MKTIVTGLLITSLTLLAGCAGWMGEGRMSQQPSQSTSDPIRPSPTGVGETSHNKIGD